VIVGTVGAGRPVAVAVVEVGTVVGAVVDTVVGEGVLIPFAEDVAVVVVEVQN